MAKQEMPKFLIELNNDQIDDRKKANATHILKKPGKKEDLEKHMLVHLSIAPG